MQKVHITLGLTSSGWRIDTFCRKQHSIADVCDLAYIYINATHLSHIYISMRQSSNSPFGAYHERNYFKYVIPVRHCWCSMWFMSIPYSRVVMFYICEPRTDRSGFVWASKCKLHRGSPVVVAVNRLKNLVEMSNTHSGCVLQGFYLHICERVGSTPLHLKLYNASDWRV